MTETPKTKNTTPFIDLDRAICNNLVAAEEREWLVTNGIGGYAMGTVAGTLTRGYHGLLVAPLHPPLERTVLLTKLDETATYQNTSFPLYANHWDHDHISPTGYEHIEHFFLEDDIPVWIFALGSARLEKRIWMQRGENTTYIRYHLIEAEEPIQLDVHALVNYRGFHTHTKHTTLHMDIEPVSNGLQIKAHKQAKPFYVLSEQASATPQHKWLEHFYLKTEAARGIPPHDNNLLAGSFTATLKPGETVTFVGSTDAHPNLDGIAAYQTRKAYQTDLLDQFENTPIGIQQLVLSADQFIVERTSVGQVKGHTIIAGYPWFSDWGRDTMISLPGLTLTTGRPVVAATIIKTFAQYIDQGMLPNRFPEASETPEYNTIDATLWYFQAIYAYYQTTGDDALLRELFPALMDIITWHRKGTRHQIHEDPHDHLLYGGMPDLQLTWMDAKVGHKVITPRIGKPVEINALWYNALRIMADIARTVEDIDSLHAIGYDSLADLVRIGFKRFWNDTNGYCYDVLDSQDKTGDELRPNQLIAVSLPYSPLTDAQQKAVVDTCAASLLTPYGLRSLAPNDKNYIGHYAGKVAHRDTAYHQGTVWPWLMGPFVMAHLKVYGDKKTAMTFLAPLLENLTNAGLGSINEIFDGDAPHAPQGCPAQAWSVAELLRAWQLASNTPAF